MSCEVVIVGVPSAPDCASSRTWRAPAHFVRGRLVERFGPDAAVCREAAGVVSAGIGIDIAANSRSGGCCGG